MKQFIALATLLILSLTIHAQKAFYADYDWEEKVPTIELTEEEKKKDVILLFEKHSMEVMEENEEMVQLTLLHTRKMVNTDAGIEQNNRVYIGVGEGNEAVFQKARVINPDGKVVQLNEKDIKDFVDEEGNVEYRYFALEGLVKGSVIEYLHMYKEQPNFTGAAMYLQSELDKKRVEMDIIVPSHLEYQIKCFNGMPEFEKDTTEEEVNRMFIVAENVEGIEEEWESNYNASLQKCYYKLNKNYASGKSNFYNFTNVSKIIYANLYSEVSKKSIKKLKGIIKETRDPDGNVEQHLRNIEYKLFSEFAMIEASFSEASNLEFVLDKKVTNEDGMLKLFVNILKLMEVEHEVVITGDKSRFNFGQGFEGYNLLSDYLVYLNDMDKYWAPDLFARIGFPPSELTGTKGLFIKEKKLGDIYVSISKVKDIGFVPAVENKDIINTKVTFGEDLTAPNIRLERITTGYKAMFPQYILDFMEEEQAKETKEDHLKYLDEECELENIEYENDNSKVAGVKPFIARADVKGGDFTEKAGNKILLKAGKLIGPQAELYNEKERKLGVSSQFARTYERKIEIEIPEGYQVKNPEDAAMEVMSDMENAAGFKSTYTLEGQTMTITVTEYYNVIYFPVEEYKSYEKVINAAADFNKIVLVLEKA